MLKYGFRLIKLLEVKGTRAMPEAPAGMIPVEDFAKLKKIAPSKVVEMIRDGFYVGRKIGQDWFVDTSELNSTECDPTKEREQNVLKLGQGSRIVIGIFSLLFTLIFLLWATNPGKLDLGFMNYTPAIFCGVICGACFLPQKTRGYCGDLIALAVICIAIWFLIVALPNPQPGQDPITFAGIFGGLSVLHLGKRYKHYFVGKNS